MKSKFSFKYGEKEYCFSAENGAKFEIESGVFVEVEAKAYPEFDAVEWVLWLENTSDKNSEIFSEINDCDTLLPLQYPEAKRPGYMPKAGDACVITMKGKVPGIYYWKSDAISATEHQFSREYLDHASKKTIRLANECARSSEGLMPFFDVTASGDGCIAAIGWTGDWRADFSKGDEGISIKTGLKHARFYLKPGERIRTSSTLIMKYASGEDKHNKFRRLIRNHFSHKGCTESERDGLMAFELWGGLTSEEMKKRIGELKSHDIKFEDIWIDAGWYGECTKCDDCFSGDWSDNTGTWTVNRRVHPDGLADVSECAKRAGMHLMLWIEPERAIKGTKMIEKHPEWFIIKENAKSAILNYGNREAKEYVRDLVLGYANNLELSCYRQDFNVELTSYFEMNDEENRRGITEIKHITGMYEVWDSILEGAPGMIIDNCASGGRRIDIETLKRSIPFFRSDYQCNFNENPEVLQTHNTNIQKYLPYNGCTSKTKRDTYTVRSSYSSSWGGMFYNAIFQSMDEEDFKWAKKITDEYRSIRQYFSADFYNHGSSCFDPAAWTIWQYHDTETQSGIVMAFRRSESPFEEVKLRLKGLLPERSYTFVNLNDDTEYDGSTTITVTLPQKRSSVILKYSLKDR